MVGIHRNLPQVSPAFVFYRFVCVACSLSMIFIALLVFVNYTSSFHSRSYLALLAVLLSLFCVILSWSGAPVLLDLVVLPLSSRIHHRLLSLFRFYLCFSCIIYLIVCLFSLSYLWGSLFHLLYLFVWSSHCFFAPLFFSRLFFAPSLSLSLSFLFFFRSPLLLSLVLSSLPSFRDFFPLLFLFCSLPWHFCQPLCFLFCPFAPARRFLLVWHDRDQLTRGTAEKHMYASVGVLVGHLREVSGMRWIVLPALTPGATSTTELEHRKRKGHGSLSEWDRSCTTPPLSYGAQLVGWSIVTECCIASRNIASCAQPRHVVLLWSTQLYPTQH